MKKYYLARELDFLNHLKLIERFHDKHKENEQNQKMKPSESESETKIINLNNLVDKQIEEISSLKTRLEDQLR